MSAFKVGEVAIGQNFVNNTKYNGMECTVVSALDLVTTRHHITGEVTTAYRYGVKWADGWLTYQESHYLRKRRPPASDESAHRQAMLDCIERAKRGVEVPA